jgi:hypothetical protein
VRFSLQHQKKGVLQYKHINQGNRIIYRIYLDLVLRHPQQTSNSDNSAHIPGPMDEERKTFLEQSIKSMTVDVINVLLKAVDVLKTAGNLELEDDPAKCE